MNKLVLDSSFVLLFTAECLRIAGCLPSRGREGTGRALGYCGTEWKFVQPSENGTNFVDVNKE